MEGWRDEVHTARDAVVMVVNGMKADAGGDEEVGSTQLLHSMTRENEFFLHDIDVAAGPPHCSAQHDLLRVVAMDTTGAVLL